MGEIESRAITDEQRTEVIRLLFELMRAQGADIQEGTEFFRYTFIGEMGVVTIDFEMAAGFADWALRTSGGLTERMIDAAADKLISEGQLESKPERDSTYSTESAVLLALFTVEGMREKLKSAFYELGLESEKVFEGFLQSVMKKTGFTEQTGFVPDIAGGVRALSKRIADERKRFLTAQIDHFERKPKLEKMPELYPMLLKVWQSAKKIYDQNSESETWRDMVKAKYPEHTFDDDLLTRVTGKLENLSEDIQEKLADTDGDHTPSTIALEHAARMCRAEPYQYGTRYLFKKSGNMKTELTETK